MTSIAGALVARRQAALDRANRAVGKLRRADSPVLELQADVETALGDLERYARMGDALALHARGGGPYGPGSPFSFLSDAANPIGDQAQSRLRQLREANDALGELEHRAVTTAAFAGLTVPQYLVDEAAPAARAGAPVFSALARPLPELGMSLTVSTWTTPAAGGAQATENAAVTTTTLAQGTTTIPVRTYDASVTVSQQVVDRAGPGYDSQVLPDLLAALDAKIELDVIAGAGTSGALLGFLAAASTSSVTYTDASPTGAEFLPQLEKAFRASAAARGNAANMIAVMHSRRWSWLRERVGVEGLAPLQLEEPVLAGAVATYGGNVQLLVSDAIPVNLGTGTDEDTVLTFPSDVIGLYSSPPVVETSPQPGAGTMTVRVTARRYVACLIGRGIPSAVTVLGGDGLIAP